MKIRKIEKLPVRLPRNGATPHKDTLELIEQMDSLKKGEIIEVEAEEELKHPAQQMRSKFTTASNALRPKMFMFLQRNGFGYITRKE